MKFIAILTILLFSSYSFAGTDCPNAMIVKGTVAPCDGYLISPAVAKDLFNTSQELLPNLQKRYSILEQELVLDKQIQDEFKNQVVILKTDLKQTIDSKDKIQDDYRSSLQTQGWHSALFVGVGVVGTILVVVAVGFAVKGFTIQPK